MIQLEEEVRRKRTALQDMTLSGAANNPVASKPLETHQLPGYARVLAATASTASTPSHEPPFHLST